VQKKDHPPLSDSERAILDEVRFEREVERRATEKSKERLERAKSWASFAAALLVLKGLLWEHIKPLWDFVGSHWK
jgi:hypothetical protein